MSYRDNKCAGLEFEKGKKVNYKEIEINKEKTGTMITFIPDEEVFKDEPLKIKFDYICNLCKNLSYLTKGLTFILNDTKGKEIKYCAENGILDLLKEKVKNPVINPIYVNKKIDKAEIELAFQWTFDEEDEYCFTNGVINIEGGTPVTGFKTSLTRNLNKILGTEFSGDIIRTGLKFVIFNKVPNPSFANQTKTKINNPELRSYADQVCSEALKNISKKDLEILKKYFEKEEKALNAAKKAKETVRKGSINKSGLKTMLAGKLSDCSSTNRDECELYLVEGNSAGGTVKNARNPKFQAVLPLRGKVLNTLKTDFSKCIQNKEIQDIITSIGVGYKENINLNKIRYNKVIIATDSDIDGSHIRILLLTMFMEFMPELISNGYVYAAQPPLYIVRYKGEVYYVLDDKELEEFNKKYPSGEKSITYLKG